MPNDQDTLRFIGYPHVREGPEVPYSFTAKSNPVLRGISLVIAADMYVLNIKMECTG